MARPLIQFAEKHIGVEVIIKCNTQPGYIPKHAYSYISMTYLLALDQGTSSSRSIVFDERGHIVAQAQLELPQIYPRPGWVEHDPLEIWRTQLATAREALTKAGIAAGSCSTQPGRG